MCTRDWKDYIPASGEAQVGLQLKGRYGGRGGSMRRSRFRRGSRFRGRRGNRYWVNSTGSEEGWFDMDESGNATNVFTITKYGLPPDGGSMQGAPFNDAKPSRLLMTQGNIFMRLAYLGTGGGAGGTPNTPNDIFSADPTMFLWYWWTKTDLMGDGNMPSPADDQTMVPTATVGITSQLRSILRRKDILNWGVVPVTFDRYLMPVPITADGTTTSTNMSQMARNPSLPWTRLPKPRIPRGGITLNANQAVTCWGALTNRNFGVGILAASSTPFPWGCQMYTGHFRWLVQD